MNRYLESASRIAAAVIGILAYAYLLFWAICEPMPLR